MMLSSEKQITTIHTLPNISRNKGNQPMKFSQLIEHKLRNIFLEKSYAKCGGETSLRFLYFSKLSISLDQQSEILYSLLWCVQVKDYQITLKLRPWLLAVASYKAF